MSQILFPGLRGAPRATGKQSQRSGAAHQRAVLEGAEAGGLALVEVPAPLRVLGVAPAPAAAQEIGRAHV